jgi:hypothetical protein
VSLGNRYDCGNRHFHRQQNVRLAADKVVALKVQNKARRIEIRLADQSGAEHIVSLPIPAAIEAAKFILDACAFMTRLRRGGRRSPQ